MAYSSGYGSPFFASSATLPGVKRSNSPKPGEPDRDE
jgi:hypothetical protein